jgi:hypothetical protein
MSDIDLRFMHPVDGRIVKVTLDGSMTGREAINELVINNFIQRSEYGYQLAVKGGNAIGTDKSFEEQKIKPGEILRILPMTDAGGGVPGLERSTVKNFTVNDLMNSPASITMLIRMYEDLTERYEQSAKKLEYERRKSSDRLVSSLLLLVSQVIMSIGTNIIITNLQIGAVMISTGLLQSRVAIYLTFRQNDDSTRDNPIKQKSH